MAIFIHYNMRYAFVITLFLVLSCHTEEDILIPDDSVNNSAKAKILNDIPGCATLEFSEIIPGEDHLQITNQYGWIISDTVLSTPTFRVSQSLQPNNKYYYKVTGPNPYEGSFRTASISLLIQGDYSLQIDKSVTQDQTTQRSMLRDALVEIIKINENRILLFWPQRQSRLLDYNSNSCGAIQYSSPPENEGVTILNIRLDSNSIHIHDRQVFNHEIVEVYDIKGAFR